MYDTLCYHQFPCWLKTFLRHSSKIFEKIVIFSIASTILLAVARADDTTTVPTPSTTTTTATTHTPVHGGAHGGEPTKKEELSTTTKKRKITPPPRETFEENCMYIAHYCMRAFKTGVLCGRTLFYTYANFTSYCQLDYVNCMERYEAWQVVHMGECIKSLTLESDYTHYQYTDVDFLYKDYVSSDE